MTAKPSWHSQRVFSRGDILKDLLQVTDCGNLLLRESSSHQEPFRFEFQIGQRFFTLDCHRIFPNENLPQSQQIAMVLKMAEHK